MSKHYAALAPDETMQDFPVKSAKHLRKMVGKRSIFVNATFCLTSVSGRRYDSGWCVTIKKSSAEETIRRLGRKLPNGSPAWYIRVWDTDAKSVELIGSGTHTRSGPV